MPDNDQNAQHLPPAARPAPRRGRPPQRVVDADVRPDEATARPPDDVDKDSILNWAAPTLDEVGVKDQGVLSDLAVNADQKHLGERIALLSLLIVEHSLWNVDGWSKKERVDAAIKALQLIQGSKLFVRSEEEDKDVPRSREALAAEKERSVKNIEELLQKEKAVTRKVEKAAAENVAVMAAITEAVTGEGNSGEGS